MDHLLQIAAKFNLEAWPKSVEPVGEGFINDTFKVITSEGASDYLLQRKNSAVFPDIPAIMNNIRLVTDHLRAKVEAEGGNPRREVLTPVALADNPEQLWFRDGEGEYWTMCEFIDGSVTLPQVDSPRVARAGGEGIGMFHRRLADFKGGVVPSIPGFHNLRRRFEQWDEAVKADNAGRVASVADEIGWIEARRGEILAFQERIERGDFPMRVTHNDTKISNFLFNPDLSPLCVIDLDTLMMAPVFFDFGDAIRSYTNTGAEDETDLRKVSCSPALYEAYTCGFIAGMGVSASGNPAGGLTAAEIEELPYAARFITFEQVLRFLMDYIDGDRYYKTSYPEHNLVRARAQFALLRSMEEEYPLLRHITRKTFRLWLGD